MDTRSSFDISEEHARLAEDVRTVQRRMAEVRATAESEDGMVSATVGAGRELLELWLDPRIYRAPDSAGLAKAITDTIHRAVGLAHEEAFLIVRELLPAEAGPESTDLQFDPLLYELDRAAAGGERR
ncbi:YbaB/EbfC family nucleoid-associated protein [Dactylosporangium sp. NPDC000244]|uniref:YbaB/EbfC family nucleoid-associated protein n=1 Tax=Dactylosporangium sp. NPDC000244 TaxID=3154365 RepID=UPI003325EA61